MLCQLHRRIGSQLHVDLTAKIKIVKVMNRWSQCMIWGVPQGAIQSQNHSAYLCSKMSWMQCSQSWKRIFLLTLFQVQLRHRSRARPGIQQRLVIEVCSLGARLMRWWPLLLLHVVQVPKYQHQQMTRHGYIIWILFINVEVMHNPIDFQIMAFENMIAYRWCIYFFNDLSCRVFGVCQLSWISLQSPCKAVLDILSSDEEGPDTGSKLDGVELSQAELVQIIQALLDSNAFLGRNCHRTILLHSFCLTPSTISTVIYVSAIGYDIYRIFTYIKFVNHFICIHLFPYMSC